MTYIQVFVAQGCPACAYSYQLATEIAQRCPHVEIKLIDVGDLDADSFPEAVFATPTWLWNGNLFSLGNPDETDLWRRLTEVTTICSTTPIEEISHGREDATTIDDGVISRPL
ncbi:MAG: hypothetical protein J5I90_15670 [Caldilineales bacterium]|nr:hypothetical protein [Caldilineales bacterium]